MAKNKRKPKRTQARHKKSKASRHDKRSRLDTRNPQRRNTRQAKFPLVGSLAAAVATLATVLDVRIAFRLAIIVSGMFLANGRCTASSWFAAAGVLDDWDRFYDCLISIGRNSNAMATAVLKLVATRFNPGPNIGISCLLTSGGGLCAPEKQAPFFSDAHKPAPLVNSKRRDRKKAALMGDDTWLTQQTVRLALMAENRNSREC